MKTWVNALVLFALLAFTGPAKATDCFKDCVTSADGIESIQFFEGFSPFKYKDTADLDTIGYGHLILKGENIPEPLLGDDAVILLRRDLRRTERGLNLALPEPLAQYRFDALSSFAFNIGVNKCTGSTLFLYVKKGRHNDVPPQFGRWIYSGGQATTGLKVRRAAEAKEYKGQ